MENRIKITIQDENAGIITEYEIRKTGTWREVTVGSNIVATDKIPEVYDAALNSILNKIVEYSNKLIDKPHDYSDFMRGR